MKKFCTGCEEPGAFKSATGLRAGRKKSGKYWRKTTRPIRSKMPFPWLQSTVLCRGLILFMDARERPTIPSKRPFRWWRELNRWARFSTSSISSPVPSCTAITKKSALQPMMSGLSALRTSSILKQIRPWPRTRCWPSGGSCGLPFTKICPALLMP